MLAEYDLHQRTSSIEISENEVLEKKQTLTRLDHVPPRNKLEENFAF